MTTRRPCPPGPLEAYAQQFDPLLASLAQRRGLRDYLQGLLLPRDRNKTLTGLAGAEPIAGAQHRQVQRLQWFLSESTWDHQAVNQQRIHLLQADPATAPHAQGVLVLDDTGDRKDGSATAHVACQYLGSVGKTDNGIVCVTSLDNYGSNVERAAKLHPLWQDGVGGVVGACGSACYSWRRG